MHTCKVIYLQKVAQDILAFALTTGLGQFVITSSCIAASKKHKDKHFLVDEQMMVLVHVQTSHSSS